MLRRLAFLGSLAAACGGGGSWQRCGSTAECPAGTFCNAPVSGEEGVCQAPATAALTAPVPGAYVGTSAPVAATLTLATAGMQAPATVALRLGGSPVATLALQGAPAGQIATYAGTWNPGAAQNGPGSLDVLASLDVAGAAVAVSSPPVAVIVDTVPPSIQAAGASCEGGCKRDSLLNVTADVTDASVVQVAVSVDLEPGRPVAVTRAGSTWSAAVALQDWPFPWFQRTAHVTVRATDLALNEATATLLVDVTRLRWASPAEPVTPPQLTGPAIDSAGTIIVGGSNSKLYFFNAAGSLLTSLIVGTIGITASASIGATAIWVASNDGKIYAVAHDGSAILNGSGCDTLSAPVGVPALFGAARDVALVGSTDTLALFAVRVAPQLCNITSAGEVFTSSAAIAADASAYAVTRAGNNSATLRRYVPAAGGVPTPSWTAPSGSNAIAPLALDAQSRILLSSADGTLLRVTDQSGSGSVAPLASLPAQAEASPVVLASGDVEVGLAGGSVHRLADDGMAVWTSPPDVGGTVRGIAVLGAGLDGADVLAVTALGEVVALRPDGTVAWSGRPSTAALSFPAVVPAAPGSLPTAYAGSQDGNLYAFVVDGPLDTAAPWPKAYHDLANTGNAGSPLP